MIHANTFSFVFKEFMYARHEQLWDLMNIQSTHCPACHPHPHSMHVDANMKLYTWDSDDCSWRVEPHYQNVLFTPDTSVSQHIEALDLAYTKKQKVRTFC
jgi:hypothetical protein